MPGTRVSRTLSGVYGRLIVTQPSASGFITAMELCHQRKRVVKISTGSKQFDSILGGYGIYSSSPGCLF